MSEQKTSLWEKWKVQFAFVAGALVVSSVWGTCSYAPSLSALEEMVGESTSTSESPATEVAVVPGVEEVVVTASGTETAATGTETTTTGTETTTTGTETATTGTETTTTAVEFVPTTTVVSPTTTVGTPTTTTTTATTK